jgi:O-antigen/teichoic acid export membrane protein
LAIIISLLLLTGAGPLSNFWDAPGLDSLFYLYALNTIIFIPFLHFEYLQTAHSNFKAIFICNLCRLGLPCLYLLVLFFTTRDVSLFDLAIVQIIATIIASILSYTFVKNDARVFEGVNRKLFKELFHFGKYTFGTNISSMSRTQTVG